jgi:GcrA cell cycle regulator
MPHLSRAADEQRGGQTLPREGEAMSSRNTGNWTEDRVERLKELWDKGRSCSIIAAELGGVTRNAVIGKVCRLGLPKRITVQRSTRMRGKGRSTRVLFRPVAYCEVVTAPKCPEHIGLSLLELKDGPISQCRYIHGNGRGDPYTFCAQPVREGSSFCEFHHRLCWVKSPPRAPKTSAAERRAA